MSLWNADEGRANRAVRAAQAVAMIRAHWMDAQEAGGCNGCHSRDDVLVIRRAAGSGLEARYCGQCLRQIFEAAGLAKPKKPRAIVGGITIAVDADVPLDEIHFHSAKGKQVVKL